MNTICYEVGKGLYLNITNKCSNSCDFCIRKNGAGAYGSDPLWLDHEPTYEEIIADIDRFDPRKYDEVVFCGYGEPTERLSVLCEVAKYIKEKYSSYLRINTNGHSDLINGRDTSADFSLFDCVSVSLNSTTKEGYEKLCHSRYGEKSYDALLTFAVNVKKYVPNVMLSVVRGPLNDDEIEICRKIAEERGVSLKVRDYIG